MPMTLKVTSLLMSVCAVGLYVFSVQRPDDPLFYIISNNLFTVIGRLLLAALLVHLAFRTFFKYALTHIVLAALAVALVGFSLSGLLVASLDYQLYEVVKPLDFIYMLTIGIFYMLAATSYGRGTERLPRISRPRSPQLRLFSRAT